MEAAYIEALNPGCLRERHDTGKIRDRALLREAERLNRMVPPAPLPELNEAPSGSRTTIPPPSWHKNTK